jgi:hypothetical protein
MSSRNLDAIDKSGRRRVAQFSVRPRRGLPIAMSRGGVRGVTRGTTQYEHSWCRSAIGAKQQEEVVISI